MNNKVIKEDKILSKEDLLFNKYVLLKTGK
jgi:hypothetical protein